MEGRTNEKENRIEEGASAEERRMRERNERFRLFSFLLLLCCAHLAIHNDNRHLSRVRSISIYLGIDRSLARSLITYQSIN